MPSALQLHRQRRDTPLWARGRHAWQRFGGLISHLRSPTRRAESALPHWMHVLVGVTDDGLRVPGTRVRLGLDALLGAVLPGAGDALGGVTAATMMFVAWQRGAPGSLLLRMLGNAAVDIGFGAIPLVGDVFDLGFHANRRNLELLEGFLSRKATARRASRWTAGMLLALLVAVMLLGLGLAIGLFVWAWRQL